MRRASGPCCAGKPRARSGPGTYPRARAIWQTNAHTQKQNRKRATRKRVTEVRNISNALAGCRAHHVTGMSVLVLVLAPSWLCCVFIVFRLSLFYSWFFFVAFLLPVTVLVGEPKELLDGHGGLGVGAQVAQHGLPRSHRRLLQHAAPAHRARRPASAAVAGAGAPNHWTGHAEGLALGFHGGPELGDVDAPISRRVHLVQEERALRLGQHRTAPAEKWKDGRMERGEGGLGTHAWESYHACGSAADRHTSSLFTTARARRAAKESCLERLSCVRDGIIVQLCGRRAVAVVVVSPREGGAELVDV